MQKRTGQRATEVPACKDYRKKYYNLIQRFLDVVFKHYGQKLVSVVLYGSVARDAFRPDSDIDVLLICDDLPRGRVNRIEDFIEHVEKAMSSEISVLRAEGITPFFSPLIKTKEEAAYGSPLFLDISEEGKILYDRDNFFHDYISKFKSKLQHMGSKKINFKGGYYWLLKPDYKHGDMIEL